MFVKGRFCEICHLQMTNSRAPRCTKTSGTLGLEDPAAREGICKRIIRYFIKYSAHLFTWKM